MKYIHKHLEWVVFSMGLVLMGMMNPEVTGTSLCLFDLLGFDFCPGDGLGHSIAYTFRGDLSSAINANIAGPAAVVILTFRVMYIWKNLYHQSKLTKEEDKNG